MNERAETVTAPAPRRVQAGWMLTSGVVQAAVAFGSNLVLVRHVDPAGFGRFALTLAVVSLILTVFSLRLGAQIIRLRDDELDAAGRRVYASAIWFETLLAGALALGWLAWTGELGTLGIALLAAVLLRHFANQARAFFERGQPYRRLAALEGGAHLAAHVCAVGLAVAGFGWAALVLRELILSVLVLGGLGLVGGLRLPRPRWLAPQELARVARDARGLWLEGALESGFARVVVLVGGAVGGVTGAGFLFQAQALATRPHQLLQPIAGRLPYNWFSRASTPARVDERKRILRRLAPPLAVLALVTLVFADPVVPFLLGERWAPAADLLAAMSGVVVFASLFATLKFYLLARRLTRFVVLARIAQGIGFALPLAPLAFGETVSIESVALGLSLAYGLAFLTAFVLTRRAEAA